MTRGIRPDRDYKTTAPLPQPYKDELEKPDNVFSTVEKSDSSVTVPNDTIDGSLLPQNHIRPQRSQFYRRLIKSAITILALLGLFVTISRSLRFLQFHCPRIPLLQYQQCNTTSSTTNSINGNFDLYSCLEIKSQSGSIAITISPKLRNERSTVKISSRSGSVNVVMVNLLSVGVQDSASISPPIDLDLSSQSGSVFLDWVLVPGSSTRTYSQSGMQKLEFSTIGLGPDSPTTYLKTETVSGSQNVHVQPFWRDVGGHEDRLTALRAEHTCQGSGSIDVSYPDSWEGTLNIASFGSGSTDVQGDGLVVESREQHRLKAHKGDGKGYVRIFELGSGSVRFALW